MITPWCDDIQQTPRRLTNPNIKLYKYGLPLQLKSRIEEKKVENKKEMKFSSSLENYKKYLHKKLYRERKLQQLKPDNILKK